MQRSESGLGDIKMVTAVSGVPAALVFVSAARVRRFAF